jgi:proteasome lid subunit RPN8/RPN11
MQTAIGAQPDPKELQELAAALPLGIGFVGIYHSHPDAVFHSSTDDRSLMTFSRFYPKMLSAVTNGTETKWFRFDGETSFAEFEINQAFVLGQRLQLVKVVAQAQYDITVNPQKPAIPQFASAMRNAFLAAWTSATVEFLAIDSKKDATLAGEQAPVDLVVAMSKTLPTKHGKRVLLKKVKPQDMKCLQDGRTAVRIDVKLPPPKQDQSAARLTGTISLDAVLAIATGSTPAGNLLDEIRDALVDDLAVKAGRGYFWNDQDHVLFQAPVSITLPYLGIPLKLSMTMPIEHDSSSSFPYDEELFPLGPKFAEMEAQTLDGMLERAKNLAVIGNGTVAQKMIQTLIMVASDRNDAAFSEKCTKTLTIVKDMNSEE